MRLILASASPRRAEILKKMGYTHFTVAPADIDETLPGDLTPTQGVELLSQKKAAHISALWPDAAVVAADTVVELNGTMFGKPSCYADAYRMLRSLSGQTHVVHTGYTVICGGVTETQSEHTEVEFRELSAAEIDAYIATGEPFDKAGAYGIQERGCVLVRRISGDYFNVVGLPACPLALTLARLGVTPELCGRCGE